MEKKTLLFILWESSKAHRSAILADMQQRFTRIKLYEITWSNDCVVLNFNRFLEQDMALPVVQKRFGIGPFIVCITDVQDECATNQLLHQYQDICGNKFAIYLSDSLARINRDVTLLFGENYADLVKDKTFQSGEVTKLNKDLVGAASWNSLAQIFYVLNNTIQYVVLRNYELLPHGFDPSIHGDIDILVEDLNKVVRLTNASKKFPENPTNVAYYVKLQDEVIQFDFRYVGDNYIDKHWEADVLLSARKYPHDHSDFVRIMSPKHQYYTLLYHAYVQKLKIAPDYPGKLESFAFEIGVTYMNDTTNSMQQLIEFMEEHNYHISIPSEWEGTLNWSNVKYSKDYHRIRARYICYPGIWLAIRNVYAYALRVYNKISIELGILCKR